MVDLPHWTDNLKPMYPLALIKHNKALHRRYSREIQKEKLRLAEEGINQEKIRLACRFLSSNSCVRNYRCDSCIRILEYLNQIDAQIVI